MPVKSLQKYINISDNIAFRTNAIFVLLLRDAIIKGITYSMYSSLRYLVIKVLKLKILFPLIDIANHSNH